MSYSGIFFFPFSLCVNCLLGFGRGECKAESPLLIVSSCNSSFWLSLSFGRSTQMRSDSLPEFQNLLRLLLLPDSFRFQRLHPQWSDWSWELESKPSTMTSTRQIRHLGSLKLVWSGGYNTYNPSVHMSSRPNTHFSYFGSSFLRFSINNQQWFSSVCCRSLIVIRCQTRPRNQKLNTITQYM